MLFCRLVLLTFAFTLHVLGYTTVVKIAGWTTSGKRIDKVWVELESGITKAKYQGSGRLVEVTVPTGDYILKIQAPGFEARRQVLRAYQPSVFVSVALPTAQLDSNIPTGLTGRILEYSGDESHLRVRLVSLYGAEVRESLIGARGSFAFPSDPGEYILLIILDSDNGPDILYSRNIKILGNETIMINLKDVQKKTGASLENRWALPTPHLKLSMRSLIPTCLNDSETGFQYADQRWYPAGLGRFLTVNPYGESSNAIRPASWNRYGYVSGIR